MASISAFVTVKDSATVEEYYNCFWSHAKSNVLKVKGQTFEFASSRSEFVDEAQTTIYTNTKNPKQLLLNCYSCDLAKMGAMMGGETFQAMGALLWDMNPETDMKIRGAEPAGAKADLVCFATLKEGCSVEDYCELFWSHAKGKTLVCKQNGKTYEMEHTRGSMCDESRSAIYVNSKAANEIAICVYDCDVAQLGAMMNGEKFKEMGDAMWTMTGMHFMTAPPAPQRRTLFAGTWLINESARVPCMTFFGSMTPEDDAAESGDGVTLLGRWSDMATGTGAFVCEADTVQDVQAWLLNWAPMAACEVQPILDDNTAREILLKEKPSYTVDYSHVGDEPLPGESLYLIKYRFYEGAKVEGFKAFAALTEEQDQGDSGSCRPLGRWHDLGMGKGLAVAAAKNEKDLYAWAANWAPLCECDIKGVVTDKQAREVIRSKPNYEQNLAEVRTSMMPAPVKKSSWLPRRLSKAA